MPLHQDLHDGELVGESVVEFEGFVGGEEEQVLDVLLISEVFELGDDELLEGGEFGQRSDGLQVLGVG